MAHVIAQTEEKKGETTVMEKSSEANEKNDHKQ